MMMMMMLMVAASSQAGAALAGLTQLHVHNYKMDLYVYVMARLLGLLLDLSISSFLIR